MTPAQLPTHSYRRKLLYNTDSLPETDKRDLKVCVSALDKLNKKDRQTINELANELSKEVKGLTPNSALRLLGSLGRFFAKNPYYMKARLEGKVLPPE